MDNRAYHIVCLDENDNTILCFHKNWKQVLYVKVRDDVRVIICVGWGDNSRSGLHRPCTSERDNSTKVEYFEFYGILMKGKRHPEL